MCMKTYDYKDEQKDVKGKVSFVTISLQRPYRRPPEEKKKLLEIRTYQALTVIF